MHWLPAPSQAATVEEARGCISAVPGLLLYLSKGKKMASDAMAMNPAADTEEPHRDSVLDVMAASMIGTAIEFYDNYCYSMASVLPSRHSSCAQFSASAQNACRQVTPCRVSSASGTKAGTTLKTFFKLRALSFCFCPKGHSEPPLEARYRRKRPF